MMTIKGMWETYGQAAMRGLLLIGYAAVIILAIYGFAVLCAVIGGLLSVDTLVP